LPVSSQPTWIIGIYLRVIRKKNIEEFAKQNFRALVDKPEGSDQVIHGTSFYLVDQKGTVVKKYDGLSNVLYEEILNDIKRLTK
jgi:protein SCO1/2